MEQALHECGIPGLQSLNQFFQDRVINYNRHMLKTCKRLHDAYNKIKLPQGTSGEDMRNVK